MKYFSHTARACSLKSTIANRPGVESRKYTIQKYNYYFDQMVARNKVS